MSLDSKIDLYQIYYRAEQKNFLSSAATPYLNQDFDFLCEHGVFKKAFEDRLCFRKEYCGFISWKFEQKSHVSAENFLRFIKQNPGYDVYFINPLPWANFFFLSIWHQGEYAHPGLMNLSQKIIDSIGLKFDTASTILTNEISAYSNYWVGNHKFWIAFMDFLAPIYSKLEKQDCFSEKEKELLWSQSDPKHSRVPYHPYILERFFSTFLYLNNQIRFKAYPAHEDEYLRSRYKEYSALFSKANKLKNVYIESGDNLPKLEQALNKAFKLFSLKCTLD